MVSFHCLWEYFLTLAVSLCISAGMGWKAKWWKERAGKWFIEVSGQCLWFELRTYLNCIFQWRPEWFWECLVSKTKDASEAMRNMADDRFWGGLGFSALGPLYSYFDIWFFFPLNFYSYSYFPVWFFSALSCNPFVRLARVEKYVQ